MRRLTESVVEDVALVWLKGSGYAASCVPDIAAGEPGDERSDPGFRNVALANRLRNALVRLNPKLPPEALEDAFRKLPRMDAPSLIERRRCHAEEP
jgi:type I restriction enzyme R subunit